MRIDIGLIGGTGIGDRLSSLAQSPVHVPTAEGLMRGKSLALDGRNLVVVSRHGPGHKLPPHLINYKAMALGLKALGATVCFSTAAVGSLREEWPSGTLAACFDFLDLSGRNVTLFDRAVVHTDFSTPFGVRARKALSEAAKAKGIKLEECVYLCANGPRYETPGEIRLYRQLGADVVGMTAATEAVVMREAGIDYCCLAVVTNAAAGISSRALSHEEVVWEMNRRGDEIVDLLLEAVRRVEI